MTAPDARVLEPERLECTKCGGRLRYIDDEYNGLAGGGDYEKWKCESCGLLTWIALPD